jgi:hypothetical protein
MPNPFQMASVPDMRIAPSVKLLAWLSPMLAFGGCATTQAPVASPVSLLEARQGLAPEPTECKVAGGLRVAPVDAANVPSDLVRKGQSGWAIVRFSMKAGVVVEASVVASSPARLYDAYALQHVRKNRNPQAPDASGCIASIEVKLS